MRLRHALLVLLSEREHTGYELTLRMRDTVAMFWPARHSQIYPELAAMTEAGLVTFETGSGPGPRQKKTYRITEAGRDELREWMGSPFEKAPDRDELVLRTFGSASANPVELAGVYAAEVARLDAVLAQYDELLTTLEEHPDSDRPGSVEFGWLMALRHGIVSARARRSWADELATRFGEAAD